MPVMFQKEFDRVTSLLFRVLSTGRTLRSATIKMYDINDAGLEPEYLNIILDGCENNLNYTRHVSWRKHLNTA